MPGCVPGDTGSIPVGHPIDVAAACHHEQMARGKNSQAVTVRLREQLTVAEEARGRLERRLADAERERDKLAAWKQAALDDGMPDLIAERERADHAYAEIGLAIQRERDNWREIVEDSRRMFVAMAKMCSANDAAFVSETGMAAFADLYGEDAVNVLPADRRNRNARRNVADGAGVRRAAREQGHREALQAALGVDPARIS